MKKKYVSPQEQRKINSILTSRLSAPLPPAPILLTVLPRGALGRVCQEGIMHRQLPGGKYSWMGDSVGWNIPSLVRSRAWVAGLIPGGGVLEATN